MRADLMHGRMHAALEHGGQGFGNQRPHAGVPQRERCQARQQKGADRLLLEKRAGAAGPGAQHDVAHLRPLVGIETSVTARWPRPRVIP